jgi:hypothetical protein
MMNAIGAVATPEDYSGSSFRAPLPNAMPPEISMRQLHCLGGRDAFEAFPKIIQPLDRA